MAALSATATALVISLRTRLIMSPQRVSRLPIDKKESSPRASRQEPSPAFVGAAADDVAHRRTCLGHWADALEIRHEQDATVACRGASSSRQPRRSRCCSGLTAEARGPSSSARCRTPPSRSIQHSRVESARSCFRAEVLRSAMTGYPCRHETRAPSIERSAAHLGAACGVAQDALSPCKEAPDRTRSCTHHTT